MAMLYDANETGKQSRERHHASCRVRQYWAKSEAKEMY